jgi:PAS domain S-box-containing protein
MPELRLSGETSFLEATKPALIAAGFTIADNARLFLHAGSAADCPPTPGSAGLLVAPAMGPLELACLTRKELDVVTMAASTEEIIARLWGVVARTSNEAQVSEELRLASDLIGHLLDGVVVVNATGHVLMINQMGAGTLDWPPETVGQILIDLARPVDAAHRSNLIHSIRHTESLVNVDVEVQLHTGRRATLAVSSGPLHQGPGRAVISFRDVTVARQTEAELRKTRDFLHHLVEGSSDAIIASDMRGRLVVFNAAAERLFGIPAEEARSKISVIELYPEGGAREMMRLLRDAPKNHIESVRSYGKTRGGEVVPIEVSASLVKMNGSEIATVGVLRDLRERVRVEGELSRTRAKLIDAEKQAAISALAGATAHELNQPLTVILGYIELLRRKADESQRKPIEAISSQAERMAEIVKKIAKLTRVEVMAYPGQLQIADLERGAEVATGEVVVTRT